MIDRDIVLAKVSSIQRCLERIRVMTRMDPASLDDIDRQEIFALNLQRAIQAAINLGAHTLASYGCDLPATQREMFVTLEQQGLLRGPLAHAMQKMCRFRTIAVHDYRNLSLEILKAILTHHLVDLEAFYSEILALLPSSPDQEEADLSRPGG